LAEQGAYAAQLIAAVFFLVAGERLIRLSRRSGEAPERLLGLYFAFTGAAYLGWVMPAIVPLGTTAEATDFIAWAVYSIGVVPYLLFCRVVFRPERRWSLLVVIGCTVALALSATVLTLNGERYPGLDNPLFWIQWLSYTAPCVWVTIEAALCRRSAARRAKVGLGDPVIMNRYLLLALFGGFQVLACSSDILLAIDFAANQAASASADLLLGGFELAGTAALCFAFFPPTAYLNWVVGSGQPVEESA
jgi:hypothetical protein